MTETFHPLAVENVGVTLLVELLGQVPARLPLARRFTEAGEHLTYYHGELPEYSALQAFD